VCVCVCVYIHTHKLQLNISQMYVSAGWMCARPELRLTMSAIIGSNTPWFHEELRNTTWDLSKYTLFNTCRIIKDTVGGRGARFLRSLFQLNVIYVPSTYTNTCTRQQEHCPARHHAQCVLGVFWTGGVMQNRVGQRKFQQHSSSSEHWNRTVRSPQQPRTAQKL
jgi:hypothetical protein